MPLQSMRVAGRFHVVMNVAPGHECSIIVIETHTHTIRRTRSNSTEPEHTIARTQSNTRTRTYNEEDEFELQKVYKHCGSCNKPKKNMVCECMNVCVCVCVYGPMVRCQFESAEWSRLTIQEPS